MKLLRVIASEFKNCADDFDISFVPLARKTAEDKEYELEEIADGLFVFSTVGIVGKNASGKTSVLDLLNVCYDILGTFRVEKREYSLNNVSLTMYFYHENYIYKYSTKLREDPLSDKVLFSDQTIVRKAYYKSKANSIFENEGYEAAAFEGELPEDTSSIFFVIKKLGVLSAYSKSLDYGVDAYYDSFSAKKAFGLSDDVLKKIIRIFDENITGLEMIDDHNYRLGFCGREEILSDKELYFRISAGTTKGLALYTLVVLSLANGFDIIIDEIENHFHKTLVENIISLYKDKSINKKNATLIFATHYCEILDIFNRQDNIYITKSDEKVKIYNMYKDFEVRSELLKSKQFYNNVFKTAVNYEALMDLKKELKK
ncbi:AAA family ATPase [Butyrivibrio sp. AE3006]|uniref:AAA family ATPase n=1 Tax=Butyrivibrio sp. AE3006 TaxID=1280673 RepID=UPI000427FAE6|nr:AAA family ATPase [Butyrivibrio sp. AE3006]